jgi:hypothetical protein
MLAPVVENRTVRGSARARRRSELANRRRRCAATGSRLRGGTSVGDLPTSSVSADRSSWSSNKREVPRRHPLYGSVRLYLSPWDTNTTLGLYQPTTLGHSCAVASHSSCHGVQWRCFMLKLQSRATWLLARLLASGAIGSSLAPPTWTIVRFLSLAIYWRAPYTATQISARARRC